MKNMDVDKRIADIEISIESSKNTLKFYIEMILKKNGHEDYEELTNSFIEEHKRLIGLHEKEDITALSQYYQE